MPLATEAININVTLPDDTEYASVSVHFTLAKVDSDAADGITIPPQYTITDLDSSGEGSVDLWPVDRGVRGTHYNVTLYGVLAGETLVHEFDLGQIQPTDGNGPFTLAELLQAGAATVSPAYYMVITQAEYDAAITAADDAAASYAELQTWYLGSFADAPTLDNAGNALQEGALYYDTVTDIMKIWDGSAWQTLQVYDPTNVSITGGTIAGITDFTATGNFEFHQTGTTWLAFLDDDGTTWRGWVGMAGTSVMTIAKTDAAGAGITKLQLLDDRAIVAVDSADIITAWGTYVDIETDVYAPAFIGKFNVKHHGAVGDGTTDDSTAFADALEYAIDNNGPMEMGTGDFRLDTAVVETVTGDNVHSGIIGNGMKSSVINVHNTTGGIHIDTTGTTQKGSTMRFENFGMVAHSQGGYGLKATWLRGGANDHNAVIANHLHLASNDPYWLTTSPAPGYFDTPYDFDGAWRPLLTNLWWQGVIGTVALRGYDHTTSHLALAPTAALKIHNCYDPIIESCWLKGAQKGIDATDTGGGSESEAIRISKCTMNQVDYGLWYQRSAREPVVMIGKSHINYRRSGLYIDGAKLGQITNNSFYNEDDTEESPSTIPVDLHLVNASQFIITGNTHHFDGHTARVGVFVDVDATEAGSGHENLISNNVFTGTFTHAIRMLAGADDNTGSGNMYVGTISGVNVSDAGDDNTVT